MESNCRTDSMSALSQWETSLQSNAVSHWLGASLESALNWPAASLSRQDGYIHSSLVLVAARLMAGETKVGVPYHTGPKVTCRQISCGTVLKLGDIVIIVMSTMGERSALLELAFMFLAATKQLYDWFSPSVCPSVCLSVCLSVCHTFFTMFPSSYHHKIFRSYYQWQKWRPCKWSRSEVKGQGHRGQHPT